MFAFHETLLFHLSAALPRAGSTLHLSTPTETNTAAAQPASKFSTPRQAPKKESRERATHPASINVNHSARGHRLCCTGSFLGSVLTMIPTCTPWHTALVLVTCPRAARTHHHRQQAEHAQSRQSTPHCSAKLGTATWPPAGVVACNHLMGRPHQSVAHHGTRFFAHDACSPADKVRACPKLLLAAKPCSITLLTLP